MELAEVIPGAAPMGLRERKKAEQLRVIQFAAIELFEQHGFDQVTVEQVAERANVSPSTVYRHFGTKEYLVLRDEFDDQIFAAAPAIFAHANVWQAFELALVPLAEGHLSGEDNLAWRRATIWMETPAVRAAGYLWADEFAGRLAKIVAESEANDFDLDQASVVCASMVFSVVQAMDLWHRSGGQRSLAEVLGEVAELVRPAWAGER